MANPHLPREVAQPSAEGDPSDPGGRDDAAGCCQPEGVGGVVQIARAARPLRRGRCDSTGSTRTPFIAERSITRPSSTRAKSGAVVAAAADGHDDVVVAREIDRGDDVGDVGALGDERRALVDHRVVDGAGLVVARVAALDEIAAHGGGQSLDGCFVKGRGALDGRRCHDGPPCPIALPACPTRIPPGLALEFVLLLYCTSAKITELPS